MGDRAINYKGPNMDVVEDAPKRIETYLEHILGNPDLQYRVRAVQEILKSHLIEKLKEMLEKAPKDDLKNHTDPYQMFLTAGYNEANADWRSLIQTMRKEIEQS